MRLIPVTFVIPPLSLTIHVAEDIAKLEIAIGRPLPKDFRYSLLLYDGQDQRSFNDGGLSLNLSTSIVSQLLHMLKFSRFFYP